MYRSVTSCLETGNGSQKKRNKSVQIMHGRFCLLFQLLPAASFWSSQILLKRVQICVLVSHIDHVVDDCVLVYCVALAGKMVGSVCAQLAQLPRTRDGFRSGIVSMTGSIRSTISFREHSPVDNDMK